ncbi:hypothetical protein [Legionella oakridgensis]|nr:hypothetical protein [Legionella oakridgensis]KTD39727.1 hypothetical protein Loak_0909 [Legionella oakridgensis]STY20069.1 Uncharacterised protein [Legionella longbeachae]
MLTKEDIQRIITECRIAGRHGLENGIQATIDDLIIDFLTPPNNFLGVGSNPAIFVNENTYKLLGRYHRTWEKNKTIAVQENLLEKSSMQIIGILTHEVGHAFNVAAKISNSEENACIFEIEILSLWYRTRNPALFDCSKEDLLSYFKERLPNYQSTTHEDGYLARLIKNIQDNTILEEPECRPRPTKIRKRQWASPCELSLPSYVEMDAFILFKRKCTATLLLHCITEGESGKIGSKCVVL